MFCSRSSSCREISLAIAFAAFFKLSFLAFSLRRFERIVPAFRWYLSYPVNSIVSPTDCSSRGKSRAVSTYVTGHLIRYHFEIPNPARKRMSL